MADKNKLTQKQLNFTLDVFGEVPQGQAYMTHYKVKNMAVADACASELLRNPKIQEYLEGLRAEVKNAAVADVQERQERLTEIMRARLISFVDKNGSITLEAEHNGALQAVEVEDWHSNKGDDKLLSRTKKVKLHNPITAIAELNKMDHIYDEKPQYQDNRTYNILVQGDEARDRFSKLLTGKRPKIEEREVTDV